MSSKSDRSQWKDLSLFPRPQGWASDPSAAVHEVLSDFSCGKAVNFIFRVFPNVPCKFISALSGHLFLDSVHI